MKKISKVAALLVASALLFGGMFLSCSDSDDGDSTGGGSSTTKPTPTPTPTPDPETPGDSLVYNMDDITITDEGTVGQQVLFDGGLTVVNTSAGKIKITANSAGTHHYIQASCGANSLGALSSQTGYLKVKASKAGTEKITFTFTTVKSTKGESENYIYLIDENSQELGRSSVIKCPTTDSDTELTREIQATVPEYFYVVFVRGAGSGGFKFTKIEQVAIAKAKSSQTAPAVANFAATACTTSAQNDGKITISNETAANLEYKLSTADSYADVTGSSLENLAAGTYQFRYKETDNTLASEAIEVVVEKYVDTSISFTKFDAKELYGDATEAVNVEADKTAADGTWELTIASGKKAQVKAGEFATYDYNAETSAGYKWTNRLSFNKQAEGDVALKLKVGAGKKVILRVDGGSVKDLANNAQGQTQFTFAGAESVTWTPSVSLSTKYVEVTGDTDGYVKITSSDTAVGANIYGITVVESAVDTSKVALSTALTTAAVYNKPVISGNNAAYTVGDTITATATVAEPTKSTSTVVYADGSLGEKTDGTESVVLSTIVWTATASDGTTKVTLGNGANLSYPTANVPADTYTVTAAYTIGEGEAAKTYTSDAVTVQIKDASATYFDVTFNANGGTDGSTTKQSVESGKATKLTAAATLGLSKTGSTFAGWNTAADGSGTAYADEAEITITEATTLYAQWATVTKVTVAYDGTKKQFADTSIITGDGEHNKTGISVTYDGVTYETGYKMESSSKITLVLSKKADIYFVANGDKTLKIDDKTAWNVNTLIENVEAGTYTLSNGSGKNQTSVCAIVINYK